MRDKSEIELEIPPFCLPILSVSHIMSTSLLYSI